MIEKIRAFFLGPRDIELDNKASAFAANLQEVVGTTAEVDVDYYGDLSKVRVKYRDGSRATLDVSRHNSKEIRITGGKLRRYKA